MKKQEDREVVLKANNHPSIAKTEENWDQELLELHRDMDQSGSPLGEIDSELQHMMEEVREWEAGLLGGDLDGEWY